MSKLEFSISSTMGPWVFTETVAYGETKRAPIVSLEGAATEELPLEAEVAETVEESVDMVVRKEGDRVADAIGVERRKGEATTVRRTQRRHWVREPRADRFWGGERGGGRAELGCSTRRRVGGATPRTGHAEVAAPS